MRGRQIAMNKSALYQISQPLTLSFLKKLNFKTDQRLKFIYISIHLLNDQIEMFEAIMSINMHVCCHLCQKTRNKEFEQKVVVFKVIAFKSFYLLMQQFLK